MSRGHVRMQDNLVLARQADVEDLGLRMVDPDDRMEMGRHVLSFLKLILNLMSASASFNSVAKAYRDGVSAN
jgi:hypothetical protein